MNFVDKDYLTKLKLSSKEAFHMMKGKLLKINNRKELYDYLSKVDVSEKQETNVICLFLSHI